MVSTIKNKTPAQQTPFSHRLSAHLNSSQHATSKHVITCSYTPKSARTFSTRRHTSSSHTSHSLMQYNPNSFLPEHYPSLLHQSSSRPYSETFPPIPSLPSPPHRHCVQTNHLAAPISSLSPSWMRCATRICTHAGCRIGSPSSDARGRGCELLCDGVGMGAGPIEEQAARRGEECWDWGMEKSGEMCGGAGEGGGGGGPWASCFGVVCLLLTLVEGFGGRMLVWR